MVNEAATEFSVGQEVSWVVEMIDGEALGWPTDVLVDVTVQIKRPPPPGRRRALAVTPQFCALWEGDEPAGTTLNLRAGLSAEWIMPAFRTTAVGVIHEIQIVSRRVTWDGGHTTVRSTGPWHLETVDRSPSWLGPGPRPSDPPHALHPDGRLVALELQALTLPPADVSQQS
jgi:hypothetical protein